MKQCSLLCQYYPQKIVVTRLFREKSLILYMFFVIALFLSNSSVGQKPLHNDTVICIVNTNNPFTQLIENPSRKNSEYHWRVFIKGNYYKNTKNSELAGVSFRAEFRNNPWVIGPLVISVPIKNMNKRFTVVQDSWISEQEEFQKIRKTVGFAPWVNYNYVVFEPDILYNKTGYVNAYRVLVGYNEVQN